MNLLDTNLFEVSNNFEIYLNENGFYSVSCYESNEILYKDVFTILPYKMEKLIMNRKNYAVKANDLNPNENVEMSKDDDNIVKASTRVKVPLNLKEKMNVLLIGIDSVSHKHFERIFPSTFKFLKEELENNLIYDNFNSVAENTLPNLIPLLTGIIAENLTDSGLANEISDYLNLDDGYFDKLPFIWNDYEDNGYLTMFQEDVPSWSAFNYMKNGFRGLPTSLYLRPYWLKYYENHKKRYCKNGIPTYETFFDSIDNFIERMNKIKENKELPYFSLNFISEYTHENFAIPPNLDYKLKEMLEKYENEGYLENTLLIIFSDHGARLHTFTYTDIGLSEMHWPFLSVRLPKVMWNTDYFNIADQNRNKLIGMFDLYQSLQHFLNLNKDHSFANDASENDVNNKRIRKQRGYSLFDKIPAARSCSDTLIHFQECRCIAEYKLSVDEFHIKTKIRIADVEQIILKEIRKITEPHRSLCAEHKFDHVNSIRRSIYKGNDLYFFEFTLQPGDAIFSIPLVLWRNSHQTTYHLPGKIVRRSLYANQSHCIFDSYIKNYCYCNDLIKKTNF